MEITVSEEGISIDGSLVFENADNYSVYENISLETKDYALYGLHGVNPYCYPFLDGVFVINKNTGEYKDVDVYEFLYCEGRNKTPLRTIVQLDKDTFVALDESGEGAIIDTKLIFATPLKAGDTITPEYDINKLETYFNYYVGEGNEIDEPTIVMTLKEDVPITNLLRFNGLTTAFDIFKFSGPIYEYGSSELLMCYSKNNDIFDIHWGSSTSIVSEQTWDRKDTLLSCVEKVAPTLPQVCKNFMVRKYKREN
jgi:hypothetical protein